MVTIPASVLATLQTLVGRAYVAKTNALPPVLAGPQRMSTGGPAGSKETCAALTGSAWTGGPTTVTVADLDHDALLDAKLALVRALEPAAQAPRPLKVRCTDGALTAVAIQGHWLSCKHRGALVAEAALDARGTSKPARIDPAWGFPTPAAARKALERFRSWLHDRITGDDPAIGELYRLTNDVVVDKHGRLTLRHR